MLKLLLFCLFPLAVGCVGTYYPPVPIDDGVVDPPIPDLKVPEDLPRFEVGYKVDACVERVFDELVAGARLWKRVGVTFVLTPDDPRALYIRCTEETSGNWVGWANEDGVVIKRPYIELAKDSFLGQKTLLHLFAHELGHTIGCGHVEDEDAIMWPHLSQSTHLTQADVDEYMKWLGQ